MRLRRGSENAVIGTGSGEVHEADSDPTVYFDFSRGQDELRMHGGFGEYGYTTISGKIWRDKNFDGILNPGEEVLGGKTLSITQWFYTADCGAHPGAHRRSGRRGQRHLRSGPG